MSLDSFTQVHHIMAEHNLNCPQGYEIGLDMFIMESLGYVEENFTYMSKDQFISAATGYAVSGMLEHSPDIMDLIEKELKQRITTLSLNNAANLLKAFVQSQQGSFDGFYKILERHIGR